MIDFKRIKHQVIVLFSFLIIQVILLTSLINHAIIKNEKKQASKIIDENSKVVIAEIPSTSAMISEPSDKIEYLVGDLNMDGKVDYEIDFSKLIDYVNHPDKIPHELLKIADVNSDDEIDVRDLSEFQRLYPKESESQ